MKFKEFVDESEEAFWKSIYKEGEDHWTNKNPSNLTKSVISKFDKLGNVLEIGCAAGIDTFLLATASDSVVGIDIVPKAIDIASANLKNQPRGIQKKIIFEVGDAEKLKYKDGQFDFVYSLSVLHSTDISKSLKEVNRVLSDKGKAVIYVFIGSDSDTVDRKKFLDICKEHFTLVSSKDITAKKDSSGDKHDALIVWLEKGE